jgi:hypothetical protein
MEHQLSPKGNLYLTASARRVYIWPGVTIRFAAGSAPLDSDTMYYDTLRISSFERACLENLSGSREVDGEKRTISQAVLESRLLDVLNTRGEQGLNEVRDKARTLAQQLDMQAEFRRLDSIIGALLSTQSQGVLISAQGKAHAIGQPYDSGRIVLFQTLVTALHTRVFARYPEKTKDAASFQHLSFFEAYFSNYIEGTTFLVEEAKQIVYDDVVIHLRTADTHDIKGTYALCSQRQEMNKIPDNAEELVDLLRSRHRVLMAGRPDKNPGVFKSKANRAGRTVFVEPAFIHGTLTEGYKMYAALRDPVARAFYMMFMISEVHPFEDGNGRIARIMMNAELVHAGYSKIIIPTVMREDYLDALRRLSRDGDPELYIRMMLRVLEFTHALDPADLDRLQSQLERSNAFNEPGEGKLRVE